MSKRVLVVEDQEDNMRIMNDILSIIPWWLESHQITNAPGNLRSRASLRLAI